jgi:predicted small lipoprotein YifL
VRTLRFFALALVLVLPACGQKAPVAAPPPAAVKATPTPTPEPADLTQATFAPRVLGALKAKGTFRMDAKHRAPGDLDSGRVQRRVDVRITGAVVDAVASSQVVGPTVRIGPMLYLKNADATGDAKRPWVKLNPASKNSKERRYAALSGGDLTESLYYQVLGGAQYASAFKRGSQLVVDKVDTQEYTMLIDVKKAAAAGALGQYLDKTDVKTLPKDLSVSVFVDADALPRQISFVLADTEEGSTSVVVVLSQFGKKLPIAAPPATQIGTVEFK